MNFWDTVMGHNLAEVLIRNLPKIADSLNNLQKPVKRTQHAKVVDKDAVATYLNGEFEKGYVFVSATPLDFKEVLVITE
jgi:hypothetical protein